MHALEEIFPAADYTLLAFIVLLPLLGAAVNGVFGKRLGREAVTLMGLGSVFVSFVFSVITFFVLKSHSGEGEAPRLMWKGWEWMTLSLHGGGKTSLWVGLSVDALSGTMALMTIVGVVGDLKQAGVDQPAGTGVFFPLWQMGKLYPSSSAAPISMTICCAASR